MARKEHKTKVCALCGPCLFIALRGGLSYNAGDISGASFGGAMKHCTFTISDVAGVPVISVVGDFDYGECASFRRTASEVSGPTLVVDLSQCTYLASSGLSLLLSFRNYYGCENFALVTNEDVVNVLILTRLDYVFQKAETLEAALELVQS